MSTAMSTTWTINWIWGLPLVALTLVMHAVGLAVITRVVVRLDQRLRRSSWRVSRAPTTLILVIGLAGWMLAVLHGLEAAVWAEAYLLMGALDSVSDAMLYSVDSITTRGASGLKLERHWQMMGALEAADGMLLFGISTAFLFAVLQRVWEQSRPEGTG
jgi:energy-converting hydrogenase Eha subunit A